MTRVHPQGEKPLRWGLQGKLILSMLLVGLVPLLVGLYMAFLQGTREIEEVSGASFTGLADETARKLDLVLGEEVTKTAQIASNLHVVQALERRRDQLLDLSDEQRQARITKEAQAWQEQILAVAEPVLTGRLADLLRQYHGGTDGAPGHPVTVVTRSATLALFITDQAGVLLASLNSLPAYAHASEPWWQGAFNHGVGKPFVENITFDPRFESHTVTLSLPIMDGIRYQAIGVLHRVYDAQELLAPSIYPIRFGKTGHVMLIDSEGMVLSCPILPTGTRLADEALIPLVTPTQPGWVRAPSDGHGGTLKSIIGFSTLPETSRMTRDSTNRNWHTFVWQSSEELFAPVNHLLSWISVFGLVALGLLVTLGYVASSRIVTPIRRLQEAARLIGRGELKEPMTIKTGDEIEDLADEINRMNAQLEIAFAGLTDQVEFKSQEVAYLQKVTDQILNNISTPIVMFDQEERVLYANQAAKEAFGLTEADFERAGLFDLLPVTDTARARLRHELQAQRIRSEAPSESAGTRVPSSSPSEIRDPLSPVATGTPGTDRPELPIGPRTYRYEWLRISGRLGEPDRIGLAFRDMTEEILMQDRLIQAEKSGSLGVLSAGIGHELNNPLFGILGLGEAIQEESDLSKAKAFARDIVQHGRRMATIIRDFTGMVSVGGRKQWVPVDLNEQLDQALQLAQRDPEGATLDVHRNYQPLPKIDAIPDELRQAFLNVIVNSVQAAGGKGQLTLTTDCQGDRITVTIRDTGPGIQKAHLTKIFDPFFTTKGQGEGSGLGLTVAHRIVTKYGGRMHIDSEEGQGTVCRMTFPLQPSSQPQEISHDAVT